MWLYLETQESVYVKCSDFTKNYEKHYREKARATFKQTFDPKVSISGLFDCALFGIKSFFFLLHSFLFISKHLLWRPLEKDYFLNGEGLNNACLQQCENV